jgi:hypothetical protein
MKTPLEIAARKFMRAADALINAQFRLEKHAPGSKGRLKALPVFEAASTAYDAARTDLQARLDREGGQA